MSTFAALRRSPKEPELSLSQGFLLDNRIFSLLRAVRKLDPKGQELIHFEKIMYFRGVKLQKPGMTQEK